MASTVRTSKLQVPLWTRASDVKSMGDCSLAWLLDYLREGEYPDRGYFLVGDAVHQAIEWRCSLEATYGVEDMAAYARSVFTDAWTEADEVAWGTGKNARSLETALADITTMVENWYEAIGTWPWYQERMLVASEARINFQPTSLTYPVATTIDSIWLGGGEMEYTILDYKTGVTPKADVRQLWVYYWAARQAGVIPKAAPFDARFHHLWDNKFQRVTEYPGDKWIESMLRDVEGRKDREAFYPKPDYYCSRCPHKEVCPAFGANMDLYDILETVEWQQRPLERR